MWVISKKRLQEYWTKHPDTKGWLENWYEAACQARWRSLKDVRKMFPHADSVKVASNKSATVFNVCGNRHRMITAVHYNTGKIFVMAIMTHSEYSKNKWKEAL